MDKLSYISAPLGELEITTTRTARPEVTISLDLGIPKFTVFSIKFPCVEDKPTGMQEMVAEALYALLDEVSSFLLSMKFDQEIIVNLYATVLTCFKSMTNDSDPQRQFSELGRDPMIKTYQGTFKIPQPFVDETHRKIVTAGGGKILKRLPKVRHLELTTVKPSKNDLADVARVIRQFRNRSLKQQPKPLFVIVYDQAGRPAGTLPLGQRFKTKLLDLVKNSSALPEMTEPVDFKDEIALKTKNVQGIPKNITLGSKMYFPSAFAGDDMALYRCQTPGEKDWLVKFPDGRVHNFAGRPSLQALQEKNFAVPQRYHRWTLIRDENPSIDNSEDTTHEIGSGSSPDEIR